MTLGERAFGRLARVGHYGCPNAGSRREVGERMKRFRVERLRTYSRDLEDIPPAPRSVGRTLVAADAAAVEDFHAREPRAFSSRKREVLLGRLGTAEQVWLIKDEDGSWVGWAHTCRGSGPNSRIHHTLRLGADEVYFFDDATIPARRHQGVHAFGIIARLEAAKAAGARRAVTTITDSNQASIASYTKLGFAPRSILLHFPDLGRTVELRVPRPRRRGR